MRLDRVTSSRVVLIYCIGHLTACSGVGPDTGSSPGTIEGPGASTISISPSDNFTIALEGRDTVSARVRGEPGAAVRFRSSQPAIAFVDSITGEIRGLSLGTAT